MLKKPGTIGLCRHWLGRSLRHGKPSNLPLVWRAPRSSDGTGGAISIKQLPAYIDQSMKLFVCLRICTKSFNRVQRIVSWQSTAFCLDSSNSSKDHSSHNRRYRSSTRLADRSAGRGPRSAGQQVCGGLPQRTVRPGGTGLPGGRAPGSMQRAQAGCVAWQL
jgi:hypothetical protein